MFQFTNTADGCGFLVFIRGYGETVFPAIAIPAEFISVSGSYVSVTLNFEELGLEAGCYEIGLNEVCTNQAFNLVDNGTFTSGSTGWSSVNPMIISITSFDNESGMGAEDGTVTFGVSGGTGPYTWSIDGINYQASSTFTGLAGGVYTVTAIDSNGLISTDSYTVYTNVDCSDYEGSTIDDLIASGVLLIELYNCTLDDINP